MRKIIPVNSPSELSFYSTVLSLTPEELHKVVDVLPDDQKAKKGQHNSQFNWNDEWSWAITELLTRVPVEPLHNKNRDAWNTLSLGLGPRINKSLVHKQKESNVLISDFYSDGHILYFNTTTNTSEIQFDHPSDHVQGMLIMEAVRQAGLATVHIAGLESGMQVAITQFHFNFHNIIESCYPILIRTLTNRAMKTDRVNEGWIAFEVIQAGKTCASGGWNGHAYPLPKWKKMRSLSRNRTERRISKNRLFTTA